MPIVVQQTSRIFSSLKKFISTQNFSYLLSELFFFFFLIFTFTILAFHCGLQASLAAAHRLQCVWLQQLWHCGPLQSQCPWLSCPKACGILAPGQGSNLSPLNQKADSQLLDHQGSPCRNFHLAGLKRCTLNNNCPFPPPPSSWQTILLSEATFMGCQ